MTITDYIDKTKAVLYEPQEGGWIPPVRVIRLEVDASRDFPNLHRRLYLAQNALCFLCRGPFTSFRRKTVDHLWPQSRGKKVFPYNHVLAHKECNAAKGDRLPTASEIARVCAIYEHVLTNLSKNPDFPSWFA